MMCEGAGQYEDWHAFCSIHTFWPRKRLKLEPVHTFLYAVVARRFWDQGVEQTWGNEREQVLKLPCPLRLPFSLDRSTEQVCPHM